jgi:hypothetical protein
MWSQIDWQAPYVFHIVVQAPILLLKLFGCLGGAACNHALQQGLISCGGQRPDQLPLRRSQQRDQPVRQQGVSQPTCNQSSRGLILSAKAALMQARLAAVG